MLNGQKTMMNTHRPKSARPFANRSNQRKPNVSRSEPRGSQNAQKSYERYLALAQVQAQAGDIVGAATTSTPNIISDRCPPTERHRRIRRKAMACRAATD
jgi:hypothetical protein